MGQGVFDHPALPQFCPAFWRLLTRPQLTQQPFLRVNRDAAAMDPADALRLHRIDGTGSGWEVYHLDHLGTSLRGHGRPPCLCWWTTTRKAFRSACPQRLYVSATRTAPHRGLESSAVRRARGAPLGVGSPVQ
jgi:hypothetical protein